ncbi:MAG: hypothetical protein KME18_04220 [Phormidium tanganyikae FI6-MK23]|nr:hypothetical protein [Phormidium tanganyikae FI6-MK23]
MNAGSGGNIDITSDLLLLRNLSNITTTASTIAPTSNLSRSYFLAAQSCFRRNRTDYSTTDAGK